MPTPRTSLARTTAVLLAAAVGVLVLIVAVSLRLTLKTEANFDATQQARAIRTATTDLLSLMQDAEMGERGYLIFHDEAYLAPYANAASHFEDRLAALSAAVAGSPRLAARVRGLATPLRGKLAALKTAVGLARNGQDKAAAAIFASARGKELIDDVRQDFDFLQASSEEDLRANLAAQKATVRLLGRVTIFGAAGILAMAGAAVLTIMRYTGKLMDARAALETLNRELEERVRLRTDALAKANAEIQRFAYVVTHDLRSPLVNIMGFTGELELSLKAIAALVHGGPSLGEPARSEGERALQIDAPEAIGFIRSSTDKMDRLVKAILRISREGARVLRPEPVDLAEILESAANLARHQAAVAGGAVEVVCFAGRFVTDRLSLEQIAGNLVDNAVKYRAADRPLRLEIRASRLPTGRIAITFDDNGRGIVESDFERIFDLFRRSGAQNVPGEGIGLAHVRTLVRNLGGEIAVQSRFGVGSSFTVTLPPDFPGQNGGSQSDA